MELDDLKEGLKQKLDDNTLAKPAIDLQEILHGKTRTTLEKIKRSFWFEIGFGVLLGLGLSIWLHYDNNWYYREASKLLLPITLIFLIAIIFIYARIAPTISAEKPILKNLKATAHLLNIFIKTYFWVTIALIPAAIIYFVWLRLEMNPTDTQLVEEDTYKINTGNTYIDLGIIILILACYFYGTFVFTRWYLKKLYGNYLNDLQTQIKDLEGE